MPSFTTAPTLDDLTVLAEKALASLPKHVLAIVEGVSIQVEEAADDDTLRDLGLESAWELSGLYRGVPFGQRSTMEAPHLPDMITLYREAILLEWIDSGEDLYRLVRSVLIHEIAHHVGFSDEDIERIEAS